jgi:hypothetical protein
MMLLDPAGSRETKFDGGMLAAGYRTTHPAARIRMNRCPSIERTGSTFHGGVDYPFGEYIRKVVGNFGGT